MEINHQYMVPYDDTSNYQVAAESDYEDKLHPGYMFNPSDSVLIKHYLKPMIAKGTHPPCRLHQVYLYDHHPQTLAATYRGSENKWYFLTSRERKYPKGSRPKRGTKGGFGTWKATQKHRIVRDDKGQKVGYKTNLAFHEKGRKTQWLMHEYTTVDPNLPFGSGQNGNELNKYVLCKVYYKEDRGKRYHDDDDDAEEIRNVRNIRGDEVQNQMEVNHGSSSSIHDQATSHHDPIMQPAVVTNLHGGSNSIQLPDAAAAGYVNDYTTTVVLCPSPVTSIDPFQELENLLNDGSNQPSPVIMTQDAATDDHIPQSHHDYNNATGSSLDLSEYITLDDPPNLHFGSGKKVYKKETMIRKRSHDDEAAEEVRNVRNRGEVRMEVNHGSNILDQATNHHDPIMQPAVVTNLHGGSNSTQLPHALEDPYYQVMLRSREVLDQSSFGAVPPPPDAAAGFVRQPESQKNLFQDLENYLLNDDVQTGSNQPSSVIMTQDAATDATGSYLDLSDYITLDDLDATEW